MSRFPGQDMLRGVPKGMNTLSLLGDGGTFGGPWNVENTPANIQAMYVTDRQSFGERTNISRSCAHFFYIIYFF